METNPFLEVRFWLLMASVIGVIGGGIWAMFQMPFVKRWRANEMDTFYAGMAARGRGIGLPRTWRSEGFTGHDRRSRAEHVSTFKIVAGLIALAWLDALVRDPFGIVQQTGNLLVACILPAAAIGGLLLYDRVRYGRVIRQAAEIPRTAFNVVANEHGLFVPVSGDRVVQGSWADWAVTDVRFLRGARPAMIYACDWLAVRHRAEPDLDIPLIASMFEDGQALMEVVAARAEKAVLFAAGDAPPSAARHAKGPA